MPIEPSNVQERYIAAKRAVERFKDGIQSISHKSENDAARTFGAMIQPILEKYGVEIEAVIDSPAEGGRLGGLVVGDRFERDTGLGFTS